MIEKFKGPNNLQRRIQMISEMKLINGNIELSTRIEQQLELLELKADTIIINQGEDDDEVYFIFDGEVEIVVNGRRVATRGNGDHVGEMAAIVPTQRRSATVVVKSDCILGKISADNFNSIAMDFPELYKKIAQTLSKRLLERNKHVGQHRTKIKLFIVSSAEALDVAREIQNQLEHDPIDAIIWTDGVFKISSYPLTELENQVDQSDFAVAIAQGDDDVKIRGEEWPSPRDNVIFELGLFMGRLGANRAILMEPRDDKVKLPSDLTGLTTITYKHKSGAEFKSSIAPAINKLREHILGLGPYNG